MTKRIPTTNGTLTLSDDEGDEDLVVPAKWVICDDCRGEGVRALHGMAISAQEFNEDPDFAEAYFGGEYDTPCGACSGSGKLQVVDRDAVAPELLARVDAILEAEAQYQSEMRHIAAMRERGIEW